MAQAGTTGGLDRERLERLAGLGFWRWQARSDQATWSRGHHRLLGLDPERDRRSTYEEHLALVHPDDRERVHEAIQDALRARTSREVSFRLADDTDSWLQAHVRPADGATVHATTLDVDRRRRLERELADASTSEADEPALAAALSRLLRQGTGRLLAQLQDLAHGGQARQPGIERAQAEASATTDALDPILEAGRRELAATPSGTASVDLSALLDEVVRRSHALADNDPAIRCEVDDELPRRVRVDGERLAGALEAALAFATTLGDRVQVTVREASRRPRPGDEPDEIELVVLVDAGQPGAPTPVGRGRLEPGTAAPRTEVPAIVARRHLEALDADVQLRSAAGLRRLRLRVPARASDASPTEGAGSRLQALVVARDAVQRDELVTTVEDCGAETRAVASGDDALDTVPDSGIDAVLLAPDVGDLDNAEVVHRLRDELPPVQQPYIATIQREPDPTDRRSAREAGVDEVWSTPIDRDELRDRLARLVRPRIV